jgi:mono/diheme cytochrome c family protein
MSTPMKRRFGERFAAVLVLGAFISTLAACERDASGLVEWTPADHDHQAETKGRRLSPAAMQQTQQRKAGRHAPPSQRNQVIDVTWTKQCATCHGRKGKGDGPSSTMVKARDLTNPEFQATLSDEQMKKVIREGKDKMPAFNLPDSIIDGLIEHVRNFAKKPRRGVGPEDDRAETEQEPAEAAAPNAPAAATVEPPAPAPGTDKAAPSPTGSATSGAASNPAAPAAAPSQKP